MVYNYLNEIGSIKRTKIDPTNRVGNSKKRCILDARGERISKKELIALGPEEVKRRSRK